MDRSSSIALVFCLLLSLLSCHKPQELSQVSRPDTVDTLVSETAESILVSDDTSIDDSGKMSNAPPLRHIFTDASIDTCELPFIDAKLAYALEQQLTLLKKQRDDKRYRIGQLDITIEQLEQTIHIIRSWQFTKPIGLVSSLKAYQIWGDDRRGNVKFTSYYTPVIDVRNKPNKEYKYPIYTRPKDWDGALPTRRQIDADKALEGKGLELCFAKNRADIYAMQLQGSGIVRYPNGASELLSYDGTNGHPYRSISRSLRRLKKINDLDELSPSEIRKFMDANPELLEPALFGNPSYTFFTKKGENPYGAGHVPLVDDYSIAVDKRYIPLGSCLLALVPVRDPDGNIRHEYRFLLAQDVGGAIRGAGHVDLYSGVGDEAREQANRLHHYGQLWLLLPRQTYAMD